MLPHLGIANVDRLRRKQTHFRGINYLCSKLPIFIDGVQNEVVMTVFGILFFLSLFYVGQYEEWNSHDRKLMDFIKTSSKPHIFYSPATHNAKTQKLLSQSKQAITGEPSFMSW